jgi:hypothetical protein
MEFPFVAYPRGTKWLTAGFARYSAFEKAYFQILFFNFQISCKSRIEFSPANKKYTPTAMVWSAGGGDNEFIRLFVMPWVGDARPGPTPSICFLKRHDTEQL